MDNRLLHEKPSKLTVIGLALCALVSKPLIASEYSTVGENETFQHQVNYQFSSTKSSQDGAQSNGLWGAVAIGAATILLLQSLSSDEKSASSSSPDGTPSGGGSSADTFSGANTTSINQSSGSTSTKGKLFEVVPQHGLFFSYGGADLDLKSNSTPGGNSSEKKFTLGYDKRLNDKVIAGVLLDRAETTIELKDLTREQDENRFSLFTFVSYQLAFDTSLYSYFGVDWFDKDLSRFSIDNPGDISGSTEGTGYSLGLSLSHDYAHINGLLPSILIEADYANASFDNYREQGASQALLIYPEQKNESLTVSLGGTLSKSLSLTSGVLVPSLSLKSINELKSDGQQLAVEAVVDGTPSFIAVSDTDEHYLQASGSLTFVVRNGVQVFANFERVFQHDFYNRNRYTIGARMEF